MRSPRRSFAVPFVVVTAAASAGGACHKEYAPVPVHDNPPFVPQDASAAVAKPEPTPVVDPPPPHVIANPPRPIEPVAAPPPPPVIANPPRPIEPVATGMRHWTLSMTHGTCTAFESDACGHAPPTRPCDPPPPRAYACVPAITEGSHIKVIQHTPGGDCQVERANQPCPPKVHCNPGPPTKVPCPS